MSARNPLLEVLGVPGLLILMLVAGPSPAAAQDGLFLTWNECAEGPTALTSLSSACDANFGGQTLFAAFRLGQPIDSVIAVEITIDVQYAGASLPAWWQVAAGGCRDGALSADANLPGRTICANFWGGVATDPPPVFYQVGLPRGGANQARILISVAVPPTSPRRIEAGPLYYAAALELSNKNTLSCAGCTGGACLVLNSILIGRLPGSPGGDLLLDAPAPLDLNWALWQGGAASQCMAVPVKARTWGQLKSLYR